MNFVVLVLFCVGSALVGWAAYRFFTRPGGKMEPAMLWFSRFSYLGGAVQVFELARHDEVTGARAWVALSLMVIALALFLWSLAIHWRRRPSLAYSKDVPEILVTRGPYVFIRHPFYTSYLCAWFVPAVFSGTLASLSVALVASVFFEFAARQEERKFLASSFRADYAHYIARTGRFLPNPWKLVRAMITRRAST